MALRGFVDQDEDPKKIVLFFIQLDDGQNHLPVGSRHGGVDQVFINSTGMLWPRVPEGLRTRGATPYAKLLQKVLALFSE